MWVILPVKALNKAKLRLSDVLTDTQRAELSYLMLADVLDTLNDTDIVKEITIISCDQSIASLCRKYNCHFVLTASDSGYSNDASRAIATVGPSYSGIMAILPTDVPLITVEDIQKLYRAHQAGITLCPAITDGGTNGLVFNPPLRIPLMFGDDSLIKYKAEAEQNEIPVTIEHVTGLERDIDRPEDLQWLARQDKGKKTLSYVKGLNLNFTDKQPLV